MADDLSPSLSVYEAILDGDGDAVDEVLRSAASLDGLVPCLPFVVARYPGRLADALADVDAAASPAFASGLASATLYQDALQSDWPATALPDDGYAPMPDDGSVVAAFEGQPPSPSGVASVVPVRLRVVLHELHNLVVFHRHERPPAAVGSPASTAQLSAVDASLLASSTLHSAQLSAVAGAPAPPPPPPPPPLPKSTARHAGGRRRLGSLPRSAASESPASDSDCPALPGRFQQAWNALLSEELAAHERSFQSQLLSSRSYTDELLLIVPLLLMRFQTLFSLSELSTACLVRLPDDVAARLLAALLVNLPEHADALLVSLASDPALARHRPLVTHAARTAASLSPFLAATLRRALVERQLLPELVTSLALSSPSPLPFLLGLLTDAATFKWFARYLRADRAALPHCCLGQLKTLLLHTAAQPHSLRTALRLHVFLAVLGVAIDADDAAAVVDAMAATTDEHALRLAVSLLLLRDDVVVLAGAERVVAVLRQLQTARRCADFLLLVAIHLHTRHYAPLFDFLKRQVLDMGPATAKLLLEPGQRVRDIFVHALYPEQALVESFRRPHSNPSWSSSSSSSSPPGHQSSLLSLTLPCVHLLMSCGLFVQHRIDIGPWLFAQLAAADLRPLAALVPQVIDQFIEACLPSLQRGGDTAAATRHRGDDAADGGGQDSSGDAAEQFRMQPLAERLLAEQLLSGGAPTPYQLLLLYYVLQHNARAHERSADIAARGLAAATGGVVFRAEFVESLPVLRLARYLEECRGDMMYIYPGLFALLLDRFGHLFAPQRLLAEWALPARPAAERAPVLTAAMSVDACLVHLSDMRSNGVACLEALRHLLQLPVDKLADTPLLSVCLPQLLADNNDEAAADASDDELQACVLELWQRLFAWDPWPTALRTAQLLLPSQGARLTHRDLTADPLLLLGCHARALSSAPLFTMLLQVLRVYLDNSQRELLADAARLPGADHPRAALIHSLLLAQRSSAIQILLEGCALRPANVAALCQYIHQEFIDQPLLIKLVHFQGYRRELLPVLVDNVESMHVCLDFLPELLAQPQLDKQVLAVQLGGLLIQKYPTPKSYYLAKLIVEHLSLANPFTEEGLPVLLHATPSLARLCRAFPVLAEKVAASLLLNMQTQLASFPNDPGCAKLFQVVHDTFLEIADTLL